MNKGQWYIEDGNGEVRPVGDILEWGRWRASAESRVALTNLGERGEVSTVFLGLDHRHFGEGPPILYETLVFGGPLDQEMERYCTRAEAVAGHERMVARVVAAKLEPGDAEGDES